MNKMNEVWTPKHNTLQLVELSESDKKEVDGLFVIGKVKGEFFVPDGESRNDRFYPRIFWERVLKKEEVTRRLEERLMFGMMGHENKEIDDKDLQRGVVSHIVTDLYIDDAGNGIGEALILGTEAGRNLLVYLKAGAKLKVSSRACGDYKQGETHNGMPVMDAETYILETFDFVIDPGFLKAQPSLVENFNGENIMSATASEELIRELKESRDNLSKQLTEMNKRNDELQKQVQFLGGSTVVKDEDFARKLEQLSFTKESLSAIEKVAKDSGRTIESFIKLLSSLKKEDIDAIDDIVKPDSEDPELANAVDTLNQYKDTNLDPEEVLQMVADIQDVLDNYGEFGPVSELEKTIKEAEDALTAYNEFGSIEELKQLIADAEAALQAYTDLGSIEELKLALDTLAEIQKSAEETQVEESAKRLSRKYGVKIETCLNLVRKTSEEEADAVLKDLAQEEPNNMDPEDPENSDGSKGEKLSKKKYTGSSLLESRIGRTKFLSNTNS